MFGENYNVDKLQILFNKYQEKYPLHRTEVIIDKMLNDGVITSKEAKSLREGKSIFSFSNNSYFSDFNDNVTVTEIMGGNFTNTSTKNTTSKDIPQFDFDKEIQSTKQSEKQIDCWLLSGINALAQTTWGKTAIKEAIRPDGNGGVNIILKGSPIEIKDFYISPQELFEAQESGKYSTGDPDMLALELATEKLFKIMEERGLGEIGRPPGSEYLNSALGNMRIDKSKNTVIGISELLTEIQWNHVEFGLNINGYDDMLKHLSNNSQSYAITCTFNALKDMFGERKSNDPVHGNHAYAITEMVYGKFVIITDPYDSSKEIKLSWDKFRNDVESIYVATENENQKANFEKNLPNNYKETYQKYLDKCYSDIEQIKKDEIAKKEQFIKINAEINKQNLIKSFYKLEYPKYIYDDFKDLLPLINKEIVIEILDKYSSNIIKKLDNATFGWGNGNKKKELIMPIINSLIELASEKGVAIEKIDDFEKICKKELNALIYTDIDIVINEVNNLVSEIKRITNL